MRFLPNGQWTLQKNDEPKNLHDLVGTTHTVEVHPDIDHLYNIKGMIKQSGQPHMQLGDIKRTGVSKSLIDKLPRSARGRVTPEMIDKHIEGLPKHKVEVKIVPYELGYQQHRESTPQYTASVGLHPDTHKKLSSQQKKVWTDGLRDAQHGLNGHVNQVGWARIDPHRMHNSDLPSGFSEPITNEGHWHVDEIQSDFNHPGNIKQKINDQYRNNLDEEVIREQDNLNSNHPLVPLLQNYMNIGREKNKEKKEFPNTDYEDLPSHKKHFEAWETYNKAFNKELDRRVKEAKDSFHPNEVHKFLSHGHEDPQHMIHSAVNALARKHGISSISMDMPRDQAKQSGLEPKEKPNKAIDDLIYGHIDKNGIGDTDRYHLWDYHGANLYNMHGGDINFKKVINKLGQDYIKKLAESATHRVDPISNDLHQKVDALPDEEKLALHRFQRDYNNILKQFVISKFNLQGTVDRLKDEDAEYDYPVHQLNTYNKRPKKLGMIPVNKQRLLGHDPEDVAKKVQYMKLHKSLLKLKKLLKKIDD
jgi:hypothetical protein